jgi:hypothetical protein
MSPASSLIEAAARLTPIAILRACLILAALIAAIPSPAAYAQTPSFSFRARSYVNPFPQTDRYYLHVIGDYLGAGLSSGLDEAFANDGTIKIVNSTRSSAGLARPDRTDWAADIEELAKSQPIHIAVVMMGINDVRNINTPNGTARWGTEEWRAAYADEVDKLLKIFKAKGVAVYWVGLPAMSNSKTSEAMALVNDIVRERTYINSAKYIDTWSGFTDQLGGYTAYGPDITGQTKRLREPDGIGFTARGNRKLANYVEVLLRRDLGAARSERNISLAGDENEQRQLVPKAAGKDAEAGGKTQDQIAKPADGSAPPSQAQKAAGPDQAPAGAPPQAAISVFASGYSPPGETIPGDIGEGLTGLATVSPITDLNANVGERRLPVKERIYYKTLVKGESLKPKPGRADDFKWPRG